MSRDGTSRVLADDIDGAADRQSQFRAAGLARSHLDNRVHAREELDASAAYRSGRRLSRAVRRTAASRSSPTAFTSRTRSGSMPTKSISTWSRRPAGALRGLRIDEHGNVKGREIFGPSLARPRRVARWHRVRQRRQSVGHARLFGQAVRADAGGRPAGAARRRGSRRKCARSRRHSSANTVTEDVLFATGRGLAPWMASVTFGGPDLQTVYIGSLKGSRIPYFRAPVPGLPMVHWNEKHRPLGRQRAPMKTCPLTRR